jgi:hypothetical protein
MNMPTAANADADMLLPAAHTLDKVTSMYASNRTASA